MELAPKLEGPGMFCIMYVQIGCVSKLGIAAPPKNRPRDGPKRSLNLRNTQLGDDVRIPLGCPVGS